MPRWVVKHRENPHRQSSENPYTRTPPYNLSETEYQALELPEGGMQNASRGACYPAKAGSVVKGTKRRAQKE